jgi:hypothetical protein
MALIATRPELRSAAWPNAMIAIVRKEARISSSPACQLTEFKALPAPRPAENLHKVSTGQLPTCRRGAKRAGSQVFFVSLARGGQWLGAHSTNSTDIVFSHRRGFLPAD